MKQCNIMSTDIQETYTFSDGTVICYTRFQHLIDIHGLSKIPPTTPGLEEFIKGLHEEKEANLICSTKLEMSSEQLDFLSTFSHIDVNVRMIREAMKHERLGFIGWIITNYERLEISLETILVNISFCESWKMSREIATAVYDQIDKEGKRYQGEFPVAEFFHLAAIYLNAHAALWYIAEGSRRYTIIPRKVMDEHYGWILNTGLLKGTLAAVEKTE